MKFSIRFAVVLLAICFAPPAEADDITVTDLGTLPGDLWSEPTGINASGEVVGFSYDADQTQHGFVWKNGVMADLGTVSGDKVAINNAGQVIGTDSQGNGFIWQNGAITNVLPGDTPTAINNAGQVIGTDSQGNGFIWQNGAITNVLPGALPVAINDAGQVVGDLFGSNFTSSFIWQNGAMSVLSSGSSDITGFYTTSYLASGINNSGEIIGGWIERGGADSESYGLSYTKQGSGYNPTYLQITMNGINNRGDIVGTTVGDWSSGGSGAVFVWNNGFVTLLNNFPPPGLPWTLDSATAINDSNQIVGTMIVHGQEHAFLAQVVPEPSTFVLSAVGGVAIALLALCKRRRACQQ